MDIKQAAAALNRNQYREEGSQELWDEMRHAGFVAVFGASDDLMEFRGAIDDEVAAWNGGKAYVTSEGLYVAKCDNDDCPHERLARESASLIEAKWDDGSGYSWTYETVIPHETFDILEDDDLYCRGIVFALASVPA